MSKEIKGLTVAFDCEVSEEYCNNVIRAIKVIGHVGDVIPIASNYDDYFTKTQLKHEWRMKFYDFIKKELN